MSNSMKQLEGFDFGIDVPSRMSHCILITLFCLVIEGRPDNESTWCLVYSSSQTYM